jgi:4-hydroxy-4-methyl-2-oxoglutarate aldolase
MIFRKQILVPNEVYSRVESMRFFCVNLCLIFNIRMMRTISVQEELEMNFIAIKQKLAELDTTCISDANKALRVLDPEIRPISQGLEMIGIARTVHCESDFLTVIKALHDAEEDEVLVIDAAAAKIAVAGELFATEAKRKKLAGIVIDGGCRDVKHLRQINLPIYTRYITPLAGTTGRIFQTQIPVICGGVTISPGDIVFGDDDGIIVMSEKECIEIYRTARNIQEKEQRVLKLMANNQSLIDMMNFSDHYDKIKKGQESQLIFKI